MLIKVSHDLVPHKDLQAGHDLCDQSCAKETIIASAVTGNNENMKGLKMFSRHTKHYVKEREKINSFEDQLLKHFKETEPEYDVDVMVDNLIKIK